MELGRAGWRWMELGGGGWSWVEMDGAGWRWVHGLVIPKLIFRIHCEKKKTAWCDILIVGN